MLEKNDMITTVQDLRQKLSEENDHGITHVKKMKEEIKSKLELVERKIILVFLDNSSFKPETVNNK
jgi:hypothetical protein